MCLAVDSTVPGQDVIATGSKDHYIKVCPCNSSKKKKDICYFILFICLIFKCLCPHMLYMDA